MKNLARGLALLIVILPGLAFSLGLGEINVSSALNQPLRAEINLLSVHSNELQDLHVALALPQAFKRAGIDRPSVLHQLQFSPQTNNAGQAVIQITSKQPIREPFLNFLVEVQWPRGQLLREYTILLDPPVLIDQQHSVDVQSPTTNTFLGASGASKAPTSQQPVEDAVKDAVTSIATQDSQPSFSRSVQDKAQDYETKRGDTLSKIAGDLKANEGTSLPQMMIALLRANPHAFLRNNINELMAGVILRAPTSSELASIEHAEAVAEVSRYNTLWREYRAKVASTPMQQPVDQRGRGIISPAADQGLPNSSTQNTQKETPNEENLKILAAEDVVVDEGSKSVSGEIGESDLSSELALVKERAESRLRENERLNSKIKELEEMLSRQEKLISLQSEEMTQLQQNLSRFESEAEQASRQVAASTQEYVAKEPEVVEDEIGSVFAGDAVSAGPESVSDSAEVGQSDTELPQTESQTVQLDAGSSESEQPEGETPAEFPDENLVAEDNSSSVIDNKAPEKGAEVPQQPAKTTSFMDNVINDLMSNPLMLAAVAGTGLLGIVLLFKVMIGAKKGTGASVGESVERAASKEEDKSETTISSEERVEEKHVDKPRADTPTEVPSLIPGDEFEEKFSFEETQQSKSVSESEIQTDAESITVDDGKDEVLTEAEVYIAYGMHQQAEELLKEALTKNPQRDDYRLKLLEAYFSDQNSEAFDSLSEELRNRQGGKGSLWEQALAMGRQINPENSLYSSDSDPGAIAQEPGETMIQDSGSGYVSDIVNELGPEAAEEQDKQIDFTVDEDNDGLDFDVKDLHLSSEEETGDENLDLAENATLIDETLDFNLSDLDLGDNEDNDYFQDQNKEEAEFEGYSDEVEIDVDEGVLEGTESDLVDEFDPDIDTQLIQTPPDFDVDIPLDEAVSEEGMLDAASRSDEETFSEAYDPSTEDTQALDLSELGIDFSADELEDQTLDTKDITPDEMVEVSGLSEQPEVPVDDAATEFYDSEYGEDLSDLGVPSASEAMDSQISGAAEQESAEELSTEIYTPELDDELTQASGDLELDVAADETLEISSLTEQPEVPVDDAATEFYDSEYGEDLSDLGVPSASEAMDSQISGAAEQESAEELSTEIYTAELDDELTLASEVMGTSEEYTSTETDQADFDDEKAEEPTEISSILGEIPDTVSPEEQDDSNEAGISDEQAYWSQEDTFVGEVEGLGIDADSETQVFDVLEEVGTKLDLARAYIDMGDAEGARSTLEEVLKEGDDGQCQEAKSLMKKIA